MSAIKVNGKIQLLKNNTIDEFGNATAPEASDLQYGQLAINYSAANPAIFFKDDTDRVVKIVTEEIIADTLVEILGGAAADLSTLKELLAAFGSSDIATTQASILTRLSSVETGKVNKDGNKVLSTNDYTTPEKQKLRDIESGAQVNTVTSVAGKTGPVTLVPSDCGALAVGGKAADSAKLNGRSIDRFLGVELTTSTATENVDANNIEWNSLKADYRWTNNVNSGICTILDMSYSGDWRTQIQSVPTAMPTQYIRSRHNGTTWTEWFRMYHSGNSNVPTVDWAAKKLTSNGDIVNVGNNYYIKTASDWKGWGRGLYWQNEKGSNIANISAGGATGDTVAGMTFELTGVERMRIANNGCVGIGMTTPDAKLHLYNETGDVTVKVANKTGRLVTNVDSSGVGRLMMQTDNSLVFGINNTEYARFSAGNLGNLGIGMTQPTEKLQVAGNIVATNMFVGGSTTKNQVWHAGNNLFENKANIDLNTLDKTKWSTISIGNFENLNNPSTYVQVFNFGGASNNWGNVQLASYVGGSNNFYLRGYQDTAVYKNWVQLFHTDNANRADTDWSARHLKLTSSIRHDGDGKTTFDTHLFSLSPTERVITIGSSISGSGKDIKKIILSAGGADRVALIENGNVGIGTTTPTEKLDVAGNIRVSGNNITIGSTGSRSINLNSNSGDISFGPSQGGWAQGMVMKGSDGSTKGSIGFYGGGDVVSWAHLGLGNYIEASLKVWGNGKVSINKGNIAPTEALDVNGNGLFTGNVTAKGDVVAYSASSNVRIEPLAGASALFDLTDVELPADLTSANNHVLAYNTTKKKWTAVESAGTGGAPVDYSRLANVPTSFTPCDHSHDETTYISDGRLKENVQDISGALNKLLLLKGKSFEWSEKARELYKLEDKISFGYIAQEVQEIIPDIVKELKTGDGYIGVDYIKMIPFINEAIRELHLNGAITKKDTDKKIASMSRLINNLISENNELKTRLEILEKK